MNWSEPHVERLKALWASGASCSQIAAAMCREFPDASYSRNAVIGKVHRLGLSGREKPSAPVRFQAPKRVRPKPSKPLAVRICEVSNPTERKVLTAIANAEAKARPAEKVVSALARSSFPYRTANRCRSARQGASGRSAARAST